VFSPSLRFKPQLDPNALEQLDMKNLAMMSQNRQVRALLGGWVGGRVGAWVGGWVEGCVSCRRTDRCVE
jgi:hypothetical protein